MWTANSSAITSYAGPLPLHPPPSVPVRSDQACAVVMVRWHVQQTLAGSLCGNGPMTTAISALTESVIPGKCPRADPAGKPAALTTDTAKELVLWSPFLSSASVLVLRAGRDLHATSVPIRTPLLLLPQLRILPRLLRLTMMILQRTTIRVAAQVPVTPLRHPRLGITVWSTPGARWTVHI